MDGDAATCKSGEDSTHEQIGSFTTALRQREGIAARAVEFAILTAARSGEVRGMRWGELNLDNGSDRARRPRESR